MAQHTTATASAAADRRVALRATVDCPAYLAVTSGVCGAMLVDLSESGAQVRADNPPSLGAPARLTWQDHEAFGMVVWVNGALCGIKFDRLLDRTIVEQTVVWEEVELGPIATVGNIPVGRKRNYPDAHGLRVSRSEVEVEPEPVRRGYFRRMR